MPSADEPGSAQKARPKVLIVEDEFLVALDAEDALTRAGFDVVGLARSAEEAISLAAAHAPVLAVMDIRLVGPRDGVSAALELYQRFNIRSVFATAHDDAGTRARAAEAEPFGWLRKPYSSLALIEAVRQAVNQT